LFFWAHPHCLDYCLAAFEVVEAEQSGYGVLIQMKPAGYYQRF
jgi:hypothetical protein